MERYCSHWYDTDMKQTKFLQLKTMAEESGIQMIEAREIFFNFIGQSPIYSQWALFQERNLGSWSEQQYFIGFHIEQSKIKTTELPQSRNIFEVLAVITQKTQEILLLQDSI